MKFDAKQCAKTDRKIAEEAILPYLLSVALELVCKEKIYTMPSAMREVIILDSASPMRGIPPARQSLVSSMVYKHTSEVIREATAATTATELALAVTLIVINLIKDDKIKDLQKQYCIHSARIAEEALDQGGWGSLSSARKASMQMLHKLQEQGYFVICH